MKTKKFLIISAILIIIASISVISISAVVYTNNESNDEVDPDIVAMDEYYNEQDRLQQENDIEALAIMRKYNKTDATEIIQDKQTDCDLMREMCSMVNDNVFTDSETEIIKKYLDYRLAFLNVPVDTPVLEGETELERAIEDIMGYEHWSDLND